MQSYIFINTEPALKQLCAQMTDEPMIAIDTEFVRERTYFPKLCLIQVANKNVHACVDPLALPNLDPLLDLLYKPQITKVLHAGRQDLEIFYQLAGQIPAPLFDTQIAADLAGFGEQISYASMVDNLFDISLSKTETRTNWAIRPLSEKQLAYAIDDVRYLVDAYFKLTKVLKNRHDWVLEDSTELTNPKLYELPITDANKKVKGASKLSGQQRLALRALATWREETAISKNLPRRWVMDDKTLVTIASVHPESLRALEELEGITNKTVQRYGKTLLEVIGDSDITEDTPAREPMLSQSERNVLKTMRVVVEKCSDEHKISAALLASRKELVQILRRTPHSKLLTGWRRELIGKKLVDITE